MKNIIEIKTRNNWIWNESLVYLEIYKALLTQEPLEIDFFKEGMDLYSKGFFDFLDDITKQCGYDRSKITIVTGNMLLSHNEYNIEKIVPMHLVEASKSFFDDVIIHKDILSKHFGCFIGHSNAPRLLVASDLLKYHDSKSFITFHYDVNDDWHRGAIGIEEILEDFNITDLSAVADLLKVSPIRFDSANYLNLNNEVGLFGHDYRILQRDRDTFIDHYKSFFLEIVCESFYSGETFSPTEKIWRPILLMTPFLVQGPTNFISNLKKLGFQTFDRWWDEGYCEDPPHCQVDAIKTTVRDLSKLSTDELKSMYDDMMPTLIFNRQRLLALDTKDWKCFG